MLNYDCMFNSVNLFRFLINWLRFIRNSEFFLAKCHVNDTWSFNESLWSAGVVYCLLVACSPSYTLDHYRQVVLRANAISFWPPTVMFDFLSLVALYLSCCLLVLRACAVLFWPLTAMFDLFCRSSIVFSHVAYWWRIVQHTRWIINMCRWFSWF